MNIHRLVKWAEKVLHHLPIGIVSEDSPVAKLRTALGQLPECKLFIERFLSDAIALLESQKIIKSQGLNFETYQKCKEIIEVIPQTSPVRTGFNVWMEKQLIVAASLGLGKIGLPVSSDNIESLFGLAKSHGIGEIKDADRISLRLPAFCGKLTDDAGKRVMNITVKEQQEIENKLLSLTKQRITILPNPGTLTDSILIEPDCNLWLMPMPKSEQNIGNTIDITACYEHDAGSKNKVIKKSNITDRVINCGYTIAS